MRLDKYLVWAGYGTRRGAKKLIRSGRVTVNGEIVRNSARQVSREDVVCVDGEVVPYPAEHVYIMLNKPAGVITATTDAVHGTVMDLIEHPLAHKMFPVGRLDKDTVGLLLITTDGKLAHRLISPRYEVEREYHVETEGPVDVSVFEEAKRFGYRLKGSGEVMKVKDYRILRNDPDGAILRLVLTEGKYHEVKRLVGAAGSRVSYLKRLRYGPLVLDPELREGEWRELTDEEVMALKDEVGLADQE